MFIYEMLYFLILYLDVSYSLCYRMVNKYTYCHIGIHWIDLAEYMLTEKYPCARVSVILLFFLHHFVLSKFVTSSTRVKMRV